MVALDLDPREPVAAWAGFKEGHGADHVWAMDTGGRVTMALNVQYQDTKIVFGRTGHELSRSFGNSDYAALDARVQGRAEMNGIPLAYAFGPGLLATLNLCGLAILPSFIAFYLGGPAPGRSARPGSPVALKRARRSRTVCGW